MNPNSNDDKSTQQSEQFYSAKSQISEQSMSMTYEKSDDSTFIEALENTDDRDNDNNDTTTMETDEKTIDTLDEVSKTVVEMKEDSSQPQTVQVSHQETDPKDKVIKIFSDQTEANMLNYILNTKN